MKYRILVVASCLALLAASLPVQAQDVDKGFAFKVTFDFTANGEVFKAGSYSIVPDAKESNGLAIYELSTDRRLLGTDGSQFRMDLQAITRLARQHMDDAPRASFVFDKVGGQHTLTEIWLPGQDGYLVDSTKAEHEHEVVEVGEAQTAEGKVQAISGNTLTVEGEGGKEWTFEATSDTKVTAEGASHTKRNLAGVGMKTTLDKLVRKGQDVTVEYWEKDGARYIKKVSVL
jgi:hypothetical protein